ncbi:DUF1272 domain-containing protein [Tenacibaculum sp.]|nr:DUF1272 domain-containing protein [Tenacibaculum sp.]
MLEIRPNCEHCGKDLPNTSADAMICSFECTYCRTCAINLFENVCPSCNGNFVSRPIRPSKYMKKYPASQKKIHDPKNLHSTKKIREKYKNITPSER